MNLKASNYGDLKGVKAFDTDLHQSLLSTLASFNLSGDYESWLEQMKADTNKYYTHVSFYSLLRHGYRLGIILKRFNLFIERFKGEKELGRGIQALYDAYGEAEIIGRFKDMDMVFSLEQKQAFSEFSALQKKCPGISRQYFNFWQPYF